MKKVKWKWVCAHCSIHTGSNPYNIHKYKQNSVTNANYHLPWTLIHTMLESFKIKTWRNVYHFLLSQCLPNIWWHTVPFPELKIGDTLHCLTSKNVCLFVKEKTSDSHGEQAVSLLDSSKEFLIISFLWKSSNSLVAPAHSLRMIVLSYWHSFC